MITCHPAFNNFDGQILLHELKNLSSVLSHRSVFPFHYGIIAMQEIRYKILVVDDDQITRDFLLGLLAMKGHHCENAGNGVEALEKMRFEAFDAVITDIVMPEMGGIILTQQLSRLHPDLPILIMTAFHDRYGKEEAIRAGARNFLLKPF